MSDWLNEYQARACPACAGDSRAIHIHEACALKAQTNLRAANAALLEALKEAESNMRLVASTLQDPAKDMRQRCLMDLIDHDRHEHQFMRDIVAAMRSLDEACNRALAAEAAGKEGT